MNIEQAVLEKLRILSPDKQQEVLDFAEFLQQKQPVTQRPRRDWIGTAVDLSVELTEEDITQAQREMWGSFPRGWGKSVSSLSLPYLIFFNSHRLLPTRRWHEMGLPQFPLLPREREKGRGEQDKISFDETPCQSVAETRNRR